MYPDQNNSNCGCADNVTPNVTAPAPPECLGGEQCVEIVNTSCVKYDGPNIPGVAANGDNMTTVLQGLADNGNIGGGTGGAANFTLAPVGSNISINGDTNPVVVDTAGQVVTIAVSPVPGPAGPAGDTLSAKGTASSYAAMVAAHPTPTVLDAYVVQDTGHFWVYDPTSDAANPQGWVDMGAIAGPAGATGPQGAAGPAGTSMLYGGSNPVAGVGNNGDFYINTLTNTLWGPKVAGSWPVSGVSLIGPAGVAGAAGPSGVAGATWYNGAGAPANSLGANNDYYLNTTTGDVYKKLAGTYSIVGNIKGPIGPAGLNGTAGTPGATILNGTTAPTGGNNGDFYLNTATYTLYGPKAGGVWPSTGQSLIGATGAAGATGATGPAGSNGANSSTGVAGFRDITSTVTTWTLKADAAVGTATPGGNETTVNTTDAGIVILTNSTAAFTLNVPSNTTFNTNFPVGHQVTIMQSGTGQVHIVPASGVTIDSANGMTYLRTQYSAVTLVKRSNTKWYMFGDLTNVIV